MTKLYSAERTRLIENYSNLSNLAKEFYPREKVALVCFLSQSRFMKLALTDQYRELNRATSYFNSIGREVNVGSAPVKTRVRAIRAKLDNLSFVSSDCL